MLPDVPLHAGVGDAEALSLGVSLIGASRNRAHHGQGASLIGGERQGACRSARWTPRRRPFRDGAGAIRQGHALPGAQRPGRDGNLTGLCQKTEGLRTTGPDPGQDPDLIANLSRLAPALDGGLDVQFPVRLLRQPDC